MDKESELVKGGQGRTSLEVSQAAVIFLAAITGALILAGGALLSRFLVSRDGVPATPTPITRVNARIQSPPVTVKAILEQPERVVERVKVAPVEVKVPKQSPPRVNVEAPNVTVQPKVEVRLDEEALGKLLPPPKGE